MMNHANKGMHMQIVCVVTILFLHLLNNTKVKSIPYNEYSSLMDFYHSTNGNYWHNNAGWQFVNMSNSNESIENICVTYTPFGLSCHYSISDNMYHIASISFYNNGLQGNIPDSINNFSYLATFAIFTEYSVTNKLPHSIFTLENLSQIIIMNTDMIIELTDKLCQLHHLHDYVFAYNQYIYGKITPCIKNLTHLESFAIACISRSAQNIVGNLSIADVFGNLTNLSMIRIENTDLVIDISTNINNSLTWCHLRKLQQFAIQDNKYAQGEISDCIANLTELTEIYIHSSDLESQNIYGTLPSGLFNLPNLEILNIARTNTFNSTIPNIVDLPKIYALQLFQVGLVGTIPNNMCAIATTNDKDSLLISFADNQLYGTIPVCMYEKIYDMTLKMNGNIDIYIYFIMAKNKLTGSIPKYINTSDIIDHTNCYVYTLELYDNYLTGTIPQWIANCNYSTVYLNNNYFSGNVPNQWVVSSLYLQENLLSGTLPPNFIANVVDYNHGDECRLRVSDNQLHGSIPSDIFKFDKFIQLDFKNNLFDYVPFLAVKSQHLQIFSVSNTHIIESNFGEKLNAMFRNNPHLQILLLHNNKGISGNLDKWNELPANASLKALTLHNCDIYGSIPDTISIELNAIAYFTSYNNRLSCTIPTHFITNTTSLQHAMVILGNLFTFESNTYNISWIDSTIQTATNLFLTTFDILVLEINLIAIFVLCCILIIFKAIKFCQKKLKVKHTNLNTNNASMLFFVNIENLLKIVNNSWIIIISISLTIMYWYSSNYFECGRITSHLSLIYFAADDTYFQTAIAVMFVAFDAIIGYQLFVRQNNIVDRNIGIDDNNIDSILDRWEMYDDWNSDDNTVQNNFKKYTQIICNFVWVFCYLLSIVLTCFYLITANLPENNALNINDKFEYDLIHYSLLFVLAITNIYIVPKVVDIYIHNYKCCNHNKQVIVFILRSINSILIPLIVSIMFLNDCGKYWTKLWNPCIDDPQSFNYYYTFYTKSYTVHTSSTVTRWSESSQTYEISTSDTVCGVNNKILIDIINGNSQQSCLRQFLDVWIPLIMIKLTIACVNPWILLVFKIAKLKWNQCTDNHDDNTSHIDKFTLEMSDLYSDVKSISNFPNYSSTRVRGHGNKSNN